MKPYRRWFQYSLRSFLVVLTALAVWLGVVVNRAREQREAVKAIEALGGQVVYDWESTRSTYEFMFGPGKGKPLGPAWLRQIAGDDFFQDVREVAFSRYLLPQPTDPTTSDIRKAIPILQQLGGLRVVIIHRRHKNIERDLNAALPNCEVSYLAIDP